LVKARECPSGVFPENIFAKEKQRPVRAGRKVYAIRKPSGYFLIPAMPGEAGRWNGHIPNSFRVIRTAPGRAEAVLCQGFRVDSSCPGIHFTYIFRPYHIGNRLSTAAFYSPAPVFFRLVSFIIHNKITVFEDLSNRAKKYPVLPGKWAWFP
jgi:hypothetical protein